MIELEKSIEKKLVEAVQARGGECLKWTSGFAGVPDRIILLPHGRVIFVETKRPKGGRVSALQKWWGARLSKLGFEYHLIWSSEELKEFIEVRL